MPNLRNVFPVSVAADYYEVLCTFTYFPFFQIFVCIGNNVCESKKQTVHI